MDKTLYERLEEDVRFREGLNSCMNCGVCTAICPAAEVSDYDPRMVVSLVQQKDESELEKLLKSNTILRCGECLSCKTRCPGEMFMTMPGRQPAQVSHITRA